MSTIINSCTYLTISRYILVITMELYPLTGLLIIRKYFCVIYFLFLFKYARHICVPFEMT